MQWIYIPLSVILKSPILLCSVDQTGVSHIVRGPSMSQAIKGVLTAGVIKACRYSLAKLQKMVKSKWKKR